VVGPIVYLTGSMHQASGSSSVFASTPAAARPSHSVLVLTFTFSGSYGSLLVTPSLLDAGSTPSGNAQSYTSLAAISYPRNS
jgi:hypothetical protein